MKISTTDHKITGATKWDETQKKVVTVLTIEATFPGEPNAQHPAFIVARVYYGACLESMA